MTIWGTMSSGRKERLLGLLIEDNGWISSRRLADHVGVTTRTVRNYVAELNSRGPGLVIESGPGGYRAAEGARGLRDRGNGSSPRARRDVLVRRLVDVDEGFDVFEMASELFISESTLETDLGRARAMLAGTPLSLRRIGDRVRLSGSEIARRRLLSRLAHDELDASAEPAAAYRGTRGGRGPSAQAMDPFKVDLVRSLDGLGYYVNELAISDVLLHIAISAERVMAGHPIDAPSAPEDPEVSAIAHVLQELVETAFGLELGEGDLDHLARLVLSRLVTPGRTNVEAAGLIDADVHGAVRAAAAHVARAYAVELDDEQFLLRLALHVQNLRRRVNEQTTARNPLTRTLKSAYPLLFEIAVAFADDLHRRLGLPSDEDEIAYLAMHIGGHLEQARRTADVVTVTIVCPGYYELHEILRSRVGRSVGVAIDVIQVLTRVDPDWDSLTTDLVLSTIPSPLPPDRVVRIHPFLTEADVETTQRAAARVRRSRRLGRLRAELSRYLSEAAFLYPLPDDGEEVIIRKLGSLLLHEGVVDQTYIDNTIAREQISSTAFTATLAVPHALQMTARRTAIAIGVADGSVRWGSGRVQVVAFAAFSGNDRAAFQTVLEQLAEVFSEGESVQRIVRRGRTFAVFFDELVAAIDR